MGGFTRFWHQGILDKILSSLQLCQPVLDFLFFLFNGRPWSVQTVRPVRPCTVLYGLVDPHSQNSPKLNLLSCSPTPPLFSSYTQLIST
ncbi:hypothetical protein YC2023_051001 [Brassica napus]